MDDLISRADVNRVLEDWFRTVFGVDSFRKTGLCRELRELPSAQPTHNNTSNTLKSLDCIDRQKAIEALCKAGCGSEYCGISCDDVKAIEELPSAQPELPIKKKCTICPHCDNCDVNDDGTIAQPEQRWIPVSKRLPKQGQEVICQCRANIIKVLKLDADNDWYQDAKHCYMYGFVIAWMPLPEPWKEGEAE